MNNFKIQYSPAAHDDLKNIFDYINNNLMNNTAARKIINDILDNTSLLSHTPLLGTNLSSKINRKTDLRFLISSKYMIIYKINKPYIQVIRILYTRTNYLKVLFK